MNKKINPILFLILLSFLVFPREKSIAATDGILSFNQSSVSAPPGQVINLIARINPGTNQVGAVSIKINFDKNILRLDSITRATSFNTTLSGPTIDNIAGTGVIDVGLLTNPATYITTTSNIATFSFTALAETSNSQVSFDSSSDASAWGEFVVSQRLPATIVICTECTSPVYRFWSNTYNHHFYTISETEKNKVINNYNDNIWKYEGVRFYGYKYQNSGTLPIYRFWSNKYNGHFYTISESEKNKVINNYDDYVWRYEGIAYYAYATQQINTIPVYRFWSDKYNGHFYTISESEKNKVINNYDDYVWRYEGIRFYVPTN